MQLMLIVVNATCVSKSPQEGHLHKSGIILFKQKQGQYYRTTC